MTNNIYTYAVYKHNTLHIPLHIAYVKTPYCVAVAVFNNSSDAKKYIDDAKKQNNGLEYVYELDIPDAIVNAYKTATGLYTRIDNKQLYIAY